MWPPDVPVRCFLFLLFGSEIIDASDKIVGGVEAWPGEFPWLVTIKTGREFCGGALISASHILTAGHCGTGNPRKYIVTGGVQSLNTPSGYEVASGVRNISVHPHFSPMNGRNDIAVLRLSTPFQFNKRVAAIDLVDGDYATEGEEATVAGWGVESENAHSQPDSLLKVNIPIVPNDVCKEFYDSSANPTPLQVHDSVVCAGGEGKSSCFGDSGSPLMCHSEETQSGLICCGIVSAGAHCGETGVYSRVSYFRTWIRSVSGV